MDRFGEHPLCLIVFGIPWLIENTFRFLFVKLEPLRLLAHPSNHLFRGFFFWGGVIYGGHPSALLSSRQCHELRPTFPYADLKHFGLPSSPDSSAFFLKVCRTSESHPSLPPPTPVMRFELRFGQLAIPSVETASCHLVHLQNTGCVTPSAILQMRFSHPAMICFALLLKPCPLLQHNNREIMVFARRQHSNSGQPRELWYELVGARMHCMNNCMPSQAAYIAVGVQSSQYTCLI